MRFDRASGILLHPTSLPGPHGCGDFGPDAYRFVEWLASAGQRLWQLLPLGGLGAGDSPYMSSSAFAGNVLLIDLDDLCVRGWLDRGDLEAPTTFAAGPVDYGAVVPWRMERLRRAAERFAQRASDAERASLEQFRTRHQGWLADYTLFMALVDAQQGRAWCEWPLGLARRDPAAVQEAAREHAERIAFWTFCQWQFFDQWGRLRAHAHERGVKIIGDAPIFIAWQSADVWARPDLFELDPQGRPSVVAGVPADFFSPTGQRWGNPLYRWSAHAADGYAWWIERIRRIFELVDIVRIDHFRGFAGYWEIPVSEPTAVDGRWVPGPGEALFEAIHQALGPTPVIAEDLGVITPDVEAMRKRFGYPGMRILQFAFAGDGSNRFLPHHHEADTVVYTGTHDNDTVVGWWAKAGEAERAYAKAYLATSGDEIHWNLVRSACASVGDLAIHQMQDVLGLPTETRMNLPGQASGWWRWRFAWDQVSPAVALRLADLARIYHRDGNRTRP